MKSSSRADKPDRSEVSRYHLALAVVAVAFGERTGTLLAVNLHTKLTKRILSTKANLQKPFLLTCTKFIQSRVNLLVKYWSTYSPGGTTERASQGYRI